MTVGQPFDLRAPRNRVADVGQRYDGATSNIQPFPEEASTNVNIVSMRSLDSKYVATSNSTEECTKLSISRPSRRIEFSPQEQIMAKGREFLSEVILTPRVREIRAIWTAHRQPQVI
nr:unnamed protein product [Spirometra erinaceieuropaei]